MKCPYDKNKECTEKCKHAMTCIQRKENRYMKKLNLCKEVLENAIRVHKSCEECGLEISPIDAVAVQAMEELLQYLAIGTLDECRAAVEKQKVKKPIIKYEQTHDCVKEVEWKCPICSTNYIELEPCGEWCRYCGTK